MDEQFPALERMRIKSPFARDNPMTRPLILPSTFQAPLLRHFMLRDIVLPTGSPLLMTTVGLVTLILDNIPSSDPFTPSHLLTRLSLMPHLEKLKVQIGFTPIPYSRTVEPRPSTHITLPNLRTLILDARNHYLDDLLAWITAPLLSNFAIELYGQPELTFSVQHVLQFFMRTSQNFDLSAIELNFNNYGCVWITDLRIASLLFMRIHCSPLDRQVSSAVEILSTLEPVLSVVETLELGHMRYHRGSPEWHNEVDRIQWRELLRLFSNVKKLRVHNEFVKEIARSLHSDDEEMPLDILSNLKDLECAGGSNNGDRFMPFIQDRQATGHPVTLSKVEPFWARER
jgi:hypothetical protein